MMLSFTGTHRALTDLQKITVTEFVEQFNPLCVTHGGCIGADDFFDQWCADLGIHRTIYPSNIRGKSLPKNELLRRGPCTIHEPRPPLIRNEIIVKSGEFLLACPSENYEVLRSGTWSTVRIARRLGVKYTVINP